MILHHESGVHEWNGDGVGRREQQRTWIWLSKGYPELLPTLAGHLLKRRKELRLYQREAADRIGVSVFTYSTWEKRGRAPKVWHWPPVINFLGYDAHPRATTFGERIEAYRRRPGVTYLQLGQLVGVDQSTVQSWARGSHPPSRKGHLLSGFLDKIEGAAAAS